MVFHKDDATYKNYSHRVYQPIINRAGPRWNKVLNIFIDGGIADRNRPCIKNPFLSPDIVPFTESPVSQECEESIIEEMNTFTYTDMQEIYCCRISVRQQPFEYGQNNIRGTVGIQKSVCRKNKAHPDQRSCPVDNKISQGWDITHRFFACLGPV